MTLKQWILAGCAGSLLLLALSAAAPALAQATNYNLRFESFGASTFEGTGGKGYDPFARVNGVTAVDITVRNINANDCPIFVTASTGQSGSYDRQAGGLRYNVYPGASASAQPLRDIYDATASTVLTGTITGKGVTTLRYYIDVPTLQTVAPGTYRDTLEFKVFAGTQNGSQRQSDSSNVTIAIPVIAVIDVELAAGGVRVPLDGASLALDFGTLEPRESQDFNLYVRGNTPYRVEIAAQNGGVLRLQDQATSHNTIPYTLAIDGGQRSLSAPVLLSFGSVGSGARQHRGTITIGDFDTVLRGTYSDVLTVSVTAN